MTSNELRHTAASVTIPTGATVEAAQRMLDHASAVVTLDVYADLFDDDLGTVATALDAMAMRAAVARGIATGQKRAA